VLVMHDTKFYAIFKKYRPRGYRIRWHKPSERSPGGAAPGTWGRAYKDHEQHGRLLSIPRLTSEFALEVALHEIAHIVLEHLARYMKERYLEEYEAEVWAITTMRREGINVPRHVINEAKAWVRSIIKQDKPNKIAPQVRRWLGMKGRRKNVRRVRTAQRRRREGLGQSGQRQRRNPVSR
jgi:hypothetical protein